MGEGGTVFPLPHRCCFYPLAPPPPPTPTPAKLHIQSTCFPRPFTSSRRLGWKPFPLGSGGRGAGRRGGGVVL